MSAAPAPEAARPPVAAAPSPAQHSVRRGLRLLAQASGWLLHWWPGAVLALGLALLLVLAGWAHSPGSFGQALRWGQAWAERDPAALGQLLIRLDPAAEPTALVDGGEIAHLAWSQDGLSVEVDQLALTWAPHWWLGLLGGDGLRMAQLSAKQLRVRDQRPATPTQPLENLTLPLPVTLGFAVGTVDYQGATPLTLGPLRGHYEFDVAQRHQLRLDELTLAQGRYSGTLALDGAAPMALKGNVQGRLNVAQWKEGPLLLNATLQGTLAGAGAQLTLQAQMQTDGPPAANAPQASAVVELRPWASQPVFQADVKLARVDLAPLWPGAPRTDLSGTVLAQPQPGANQLWQAEVNLRNTLDGPWDTQRLPLQTLRGSVVQVGERQWRLADLVAQAGQGQLQGQGEIRWGDTPAALAASGRVSWTGVNPAALLSTLPAGPLKLVAEASSASNGNRLSLSARPTSSAGSTHPLALRLAELEGSWLGDQWTLDRLLIDLPQAKLAAQGQWNTQGSSGQGDGSFSAPGASGTWRTEMAPDAGQTGVDLQIQQAERLLPWLRRVASAVLPAGDAESGWPVGLTARDNGALLLDWQGGWQQAQRWWQAGATPSGKGATASTSPEAQARRLAAQPALPLTLSLRLPTLSLAQPSVPGASAASSGPTTLSGWNLQLSGKGGRWQLTHQGQVLHPGHRAQLDHSWTLWSDADGPRLVADQLRASLQLARVAPALARWELQATGPLALRWLPDGTTLEAGSMNLLAPGLGHTPLALRWDNSRWLTGNSDIGLITSGTLSGLPLHWLDQLARSDERPDGALAQARLQGDMVFDARWMLRLPRLGTEGAQGEFTLERRSGDLALRTDPATPGDGPLAAGVTQAVLGLQIEGGDIKASALWDSQRAGRVSAQVRSRWTGGMAQPAWPADAPLSGSLKAALPQVGLWSVLAPPGWRMEGSLQADAELSGSRDTPQWSGQLRGDRLAMRSLVEGIEFGGGELRATLRGETLLIERFGIAGPGGPAAGGQLRASGSASWAAVLGADGQRRRQPVLHLDAQAQQLRVSVRADRRLTVSGNVQARLQGQDLRLRGGLSVDQASFVLPDETTPRLGEDVVVRGRSAGPASGSAGAQPVLIDLMLKMSLGENFQVRGHGLDTRLAGELELRSTPTQPAPRLLGEVRTVRGTYRAYGQRLDVEQGVLRFAGPFDNPALDVLAIRPFTSQRVGVQIRGTAQAPLVRLYSEPDLPDSEKLAWLVLGRSASGGGAEAAVLQQAAIALLSGNNRAGLLDGLFGLDEISVRGTGETTTNASGETVSAATVTLGKRLSNRLYVAYERSLAGTLGTLSLFYDVSKRLTLRARTGEDNAIDLIFTLPYD